MTAPARKALPAIYVVVDRNGPVYDLDAGNVGAFGLRREALYTRNWNTKYRPLFAPFSIVKYIPAPRRGKGAK